MTSQPLLRSLGVGAATGLRTMTGPAFAFNAASGRWTWLLRAAALGEYVVDKLPATPARTQPIGLAARAVAAAFAGASVAGEDERLLGATCSIAAAMASAYAGVAYRQWCAARHFSPLVSALAEDGFAMALAWTAVPRTL
jgi:uncharacterized membrane protein